MADLKILLAEVTGAAMGIRSTMDDMNAIGCDKIPGPSEQYGHDGLASAFSSFGDRWQLGVEALLEDAHSIADGMDAVVLTTANQDQENARTLGIPIMDEVAPPPAGPR